MTSLPITHSHPASHKRFYGLALLCALLWFAVWVMAFQPLPHQAEPHPVRPRLCVFSNKSPTLRTVQNPTIFALPSPQGFSETFPEARVNITLSLEQPPQPEFYLSRETVVRPAPNQGQLFEAAPLPKSSLPRPGAKKMAPVPQPERIALFLSPELQNRIQSPLEIEISGTLPASIRIHLKIQPNGIISQTFFQPAVESPELTGALRKLRFTPTATQTDGWIDLRFTPKGEA